MILLLLTNLNIQYYTNPDLPLSLLVIQRKEMLAEPRSSVNLGPKRDIFDKKSPITPDRPAAMASNLNDSIGKCAKNTPSRD